MLIHARCDRRRPRSSPLALLPLQASSPKFFQAATQTDFLKGDVENLSIDSHGQLTLGPATELVYETAAPFLWSMVAGSPTARSSSAPATRARSSASIAQGKGSLFFDSAELEAHALALGAERRPLRRHVARRQDLQGRSQRHGDDVLRAATTSTSGRWPSTPRATCSPAPATRASSTRSRRTAKARRSTRPTRRTPRRSPSTRPATCWSAPARRARCCASIRRARRSSCSIRRSRRSARSRFDDKGMLYVAALSGRAGAAAAAPALTDDRARSPGAANRRARRSRRCRPRSRRCRSSTSAAASGSSGSTREDRRAPKGAVYRIAPDGVWDQLWESRDDSPYDLTFDQNGALIVGTGSKGKLYRLEGDPLRPTLLARASAQQVTAFHKDARGRLYYATANPGQAVPAVVGARAARHLRVRVARRADGVDLGRDQLARHDVAGRQPHRAVHAHRATPKRPTTPGAPGRRRTPTPTARRSPARRRATCSGARVADRQGRRARC